MTNMSLSPRSLLGPRFRGDDASLFSSPPRKRGSTSFFSAARSLAALALLALSLAACAGRQPLYVPMDTGTYGYSEKPTGDVSYEITYRAPLFSTFAYGQATRDRVAQEQVELAHDMALLRACDLALARGMPAFRELRRDNDVRVDVQDDPLDSYWTNRPYYDPHTVTPAPYVSRDRRTLIRASVRIEVRLEPRVAAGAFDAADARRKLLAAHPDALPSGRLPGGGLQ